jgi:hypothetical protein
MPATIEGFTLCHYCGGAIAWKLGRGGRLDGTCFCRALWTAEAKEYKIIMGPIVIDA